MTASMLPGRHMARDTAVVISYPLIAARFDPAFLQGVPVLRILLAGMTVYAFFVPFDQLLLQSGLPGRQSVLMASYVGINGALLLTASWVWLGYRGSVLLYRAPAA